MTAQASQSELVVLHAWRARLCARGLREAQERMHRAIAGHGLDFEEALAIAQAMDAAIAMLRDTTPCLEQSSELRARADEVLAGFAQWRAAEPKTEQSQIAAARFGTLVRELERVAERDTTPGQRSRAAAPEVEAPLDIPIEVEPPIEASEASEAEPARPSVNFAYVDDVDATFGRALA
ncbi:MAG: hypothetical protein M3Y87_04965, partial [Myxococcota bacterium]|nr:hypothetical protein [Myxococcota bacterium]